ncbi:NADP-dependent oxidoreductase [Acidihalobacter yilgarnensis]|uniref:NADP-dependent oxidoreductase n=1 Tax=Acidihalobacter yilgarnensis TaxID=2819280 RepID=A0A1D8IRJ4_9GAMM|nr:NADP-dependent oxidoreductase [Acidihalobacter yilgarnensis]AOU99158.1 NADP-dependent oxidoreductase [Acidihalobacter yilgarnensis]
MSAADPVTNRRIVLARRPVGMPVPEDFRLENGPVPEPEAGEMLCRTLYLSVDPYMRGRMNDGPSYAPGVGLGEVMVGGSVSRVVSSRLDGYAPGDLVAGFNGWQDYALSNGERIRRVDPAVAPPQAFLGTLGMTGLTAYVGLLDIADPQPGETVAVAAAAGAVGSMVVQFAALRGCRVVAIAGSADKCAYARDELGADVALDYHDLHFPEALEAACPQGIDVYFENVGGAVLEAVLPLLNLGARVPVCGQIAHYNDTAPATGPDRLPRFVMSVLARRLRVQGFIVGDHLGRLADFNRDVGQWLREGRIHHREDVVDGLENAPEAFIDLLRGGNLGKRLIRVAPEDATTV